RAGDGSRFAVRENGGPAAAVRRALRRGPADERCVGGDLAPSGSDTMLRDFWARLRRRKVSRAGDRPAPRWKYPSKWPSLDVDLLERRDMFSSSPWLIQPPYL